MLNDISPENVNNIHYAFGKIMEIAEKGVIKCDYVLTTDNELWAEDTVEGLEEKCKDIQQWLDTLKVEINVMKNTTNKSVGKSFNQMVTSRRYDRRE